MIQLDLKNPDHLCQCRRELRRQFFDFIKSRRLVGHLNVIQCGKQRWFCEIQTRNQLGDVVSADALTFSARDIRSGKFEDNLMRKFLGRHAVDGTKIKSLIFSRAPHRRIRGLRLARRETFSEDYYPVMYTKAVSFRKVRK